MNVRTRRALIVAGRSYGFSDEHCRSVSRGDSGTPARCPSRTRRTSHVHAVVLSPVDAGAEQPYDLFGRSHRRPRLVPSSRRVRCKLGAGETTRRSPADGQRRPALGASSLPEQRAQTSDARVGVERVVVVEVACDGGGGAALAAAVAVAAERGEARPSPGHGAPKSRVAWRQLR